MAAHIITVIYKYIQSIETILSIKEFRPDLVLYLYKYMCLFKIVVVFLFF